MRYERDRTPPRADPSPETVEICIRLTWVHQGPVEVDHEGQIIKLPDSLQVGGVYRLRSSVRDQPEPDADAVYVGRAVKDAEGRVCVHVRDGKKKFAENVDASEGWVEVDLATEVRVNGQTLDEEALADERVLEAIESAGVLDALPFWNLQNKR